MNRLHQEISPYLLQHAENPVDWQPWDAEALALARAQQKPIFLSIGYSACHWCHVMAHESFEDPRIAELLNEHFVAIKVDREERPDLDQIYMEAVQAMTGRGGWPMSVFLTPDVKPFFGGTYWPAHRRGGMVGFDEVLTVVADAWQNRREELLQQAEAITRFLDADHDAPGGLFRSSSAALAAENGTVPLPDLTDAPIEAAIELLGQSFDPRMGGFGPPPKFPRPIDLSLLLRRWRQSHQEHVLDMATLTLDRMAAGGIYDHLGGGFFRYSVDGRWLVPHFEKMLYDNALLAGCYLDAWQGTGQPHYARVVRETLDYLLRDMTGPGGEIYSAEDADSEGEEGKFYLWTPQEVTAALGAEQAKTFCYVYDVTEPGNFEGRNILNLSKPVPLCAKILGRDAGQLEAELTEDRAALLALRKKRVPPGRDDKVLVSWNSLAIESLARAGAALGEPRYLAAAVTAAEFLMENLRDDQHRLLHCWRGGRAKHPAYLDDCASLANACLTLYETRHEPRYLDEAVRLADEIRASFSDPAHGGFFYTAADHGPLLVRKKDLFDSATPSGTGLAATALVRLAHLTDRDDYRRAAEETFRSAMGSLQRAPTAAGQLLLALDMLLHQQQPVGMSGTSG
jgi:uncharacterized protein